MNNNIIKEKVKINFKTAYKKNIHTDHKMEKSSNKQENAQELVLHTE